MIINPQLAYDLHGRISTGVTTRKESWNQVSPLSKGKKDPKDHATLRELVFDVQDKSIIVFDL